MTTKRSAQCSTPPPAKRARTDPGAPSKLAACRKLSTPPTKKECTTPGAPSKAPRYPDSPGYDPKSKTFSPWIAHTESDDDQIFCSDSDSEDEDLSKWWALAEIEETHELDQNGNIV